MLLWKKKTINDQKQTFSILQLPMYVYLICEFEEMICQDALSLSSTQFLTEMNNPQPRFIPEMNWTSLNLGL